MSADFCAGYASGAIGILVGNPLDLVKTRLQARTVLSSNYISTAPQGGLSQGSRSLAYWKNLARGSAAPILGYGGLNALLFVTYNRSLAVLDPESSVHGPSQSSPAWCIWTAGALGGLATFVVSAPTELIKCRAQVSNPPQSSWDIARSIWAHSRLRGFYMGGAITSVRDAVGYGFYFWSYELSKRAVVCKDDSRRQEALKILLCGGLAGIVTWASVFPLDAIKTRVQTWDLTRSDSARLGRNGRRLRPSTFSITKEAYQSGGFGVFFRGLGVCSARAFVVNAVQWAIYEWMMKLLEP